ncbi:hypothetical protein ACFJIW_12095 [Tahibacter sp. UC22_41]|uniref:hypothetical protein n=1 Tax=Tahibacter sp. UC22_41 TaxID=3350178 RepID=UPI0036DDE390
MRAALAATSIAFFVLAANTALAQQPAQSDPSPKTKIEAFQVQTGTVVIKGYTEIGRISAMGSVEVSAMEFIDAATSKKQTGVVIEIKEAGRLDNEDRSFIDYDEVDALLKGLEYISKATSEVTKLGKFEATYKTKGNFSATTYNDSSGNIAAAVKSGYIRPTTAFLSLEQLNTLRDLVNQAKQKLDETK